jgi:hypothetical protein
VNPQAELIWQGRIQLGDEPGVYGDGTYGGLMCSVPLTVFHTPGGGHAPVTIALETEGVKTYPPYPGHEVAVIRHYPDPGNAQSWLEQVLATAYLDSGANNTISFPNLSLSAFGERIHLSIRIRVDTSVPAGLYDDFLIGRLTLDASPAFDYYASLGFDYGS